MNSRQAQSLKIFISEKDRHENQPLHEWLLHEAHRMGVTLATVSRCHSGFANHGELHTAKILTLSLDLPMVVELVDSPEKIHSFQEAISGAINQGIVTSAPVDAWFYTSPSD
jgi:PII-like signaling protein